MAHPPKYPPSISVVLPSPRPLRLKLLDDGVTHHVLVRLG
jgi:hypothetical protein